MHKHHIVPRHAGGTDDPSNTEILTIPEHAERHLERYNKLGDWKDKLAYLALSKQINREEIQRELGRRVGLSRRGSHPKKSPEHRANLSKSMRGRAKSPEHKQKLSEAMMGNHNYKGKK